MALTRLEADERAKKIWGEDQVKEITLRSFAPPGWWTIVLHNGTHHSLDGNGHTDCHADCAICESQVCT